MAAKSFQNRDDYRKQMELEEARKAGLAPAALDEDGKEINPHIPQYMSSAPWYLNSEHPSLKHQKNWKAKGDGSSEWYERGAKTFQATKFRKGACDNCGALTHVTKLCTERPRKVGAKFSGKHIAADEKVQSVALDFDGKRDRWNGYDAAEYSRVVERYDRADALKSKLSTEKELQRKFRAEERTKRKAGGGGGDGGADAATLDDSDDDDDGGEGDDAADAAEDKVADTEEVAFNTVTKRVRTAGGGSSGTVRNLRIREDTAKYLRNLDPASAHYDPKTRSMRENPTPEDPNAMFRGDNHLRHSGDALELARIQRHAWEAADRQQDVHAQAAPSAAQLLHAEFLLKKAALASETKADILARYGSAAAVDRPPDALLLGQTESYVEYDRAGRPVAGPGGGVVVPRSRYEEDTLVNNHRAVWGSWFAAGQWGYACCRQLIKGSYCTGAAGAEAAAAAGELMRANMARKVADDAARDAAGGEPAAEAPRRAGWGTDVEDGIELDADKLRAAVVKEAARARGEVDGGAEGGKNKRGFNAADASVEVTEEEMEAYRLAKARSDDPLTGMGGASGTKGYDLV